MSDVKRYNANVFFPGCLGPLSREVVLAELEAEAQALREEVAALRARVVVVPDRLKSADSISRMLREIGYDGDVNYHHACEIWNACLDELARLNGKVVSEGLLRRVINGWHDHTDADAIEQLIALLDGEPT